MKCKLICNKIDIGLLCLFAFFCHVCVEKDFEATSGQRETNADINTFFIERIIMSENHRKIIKTKIDAFDIKLKKSSYKNTLGKFLMHKLEKLQ